MEDPPYQKENKQQGRFFYAHLADRLPVGQWAPPQDFPGTEACYERGGDEEWDRKSIQIKRMLEIPTKRSTGGACASAKQTRKTRERLETTRHRGDQTFPDWQGSQYGCAGDKRHSDESLAWSQRPHRSVPHFGGVSLLAHTGSRGNHDGHLPLGRIFFKVGDEGGGRVAEVLLESFSEFARDANRAVGASGVQGCECFKNSVRGLEVDAGLGSRGSGSEFVGTAAAFDRQETAEIKTVAWEARPHEGGENGRWTWEHAHGESSFDASADEPVAWVGDTGHAGIRDESDMGSPCDAVCNILGAEGFVVSVQAEEWLFNAKMLEEKSAVPRILGSDEVGGLEDLDGTQGDILPIADGGGNDA